MSGQELDNWRRQLLAELAAARGVPLPLRPLLQRLAGSPQQRFERMQWLLEQVGAEVVRIDGEYRLVEGRPGPLSDGEWADLAAAVAEAASGESSERAGPREDFPFKSSPYRSFPFRFRSVGIISGRTRNYYRT